MTDKKISELTSNGTLNGDELVELVQSGSNVKALLSAIKTFITTDYLTSSTVLKYIPNTIRDVKLFDLLQHQQLTLRLHKQKQNI